MAIADFHTDAAEYGFNRGDKINSTFGGQLLPPPTLNISAPSLIKTDSSEYTFYEDRFFRITNDPSEMLWAYDDKTYNFKYLQENGKCQAALVCLLSLGSSFSN